MKYVALVYSNPGAFEALLPGERDELMSEADAYLKEFSESGELIGEGFALPEPHQLWVYFEMGLPDTLALRPWARAWGGHLLPPHPGPEGDMQDRCSHVEACRLGVRRGSCRPAWQGRPAWANSQVTCSGSRTLVRCGGRRRMARRFQRDVPIPLSRGGK